MSIYDLTPTAGACPVCYATAATRLYAVTSADSAQHFIRRDVDPDRHAKMRAEIERLWGGPTCQVLRCDECAFCYAYPYVAGREGFYGLFLSAPDFPKDRFEFDQTHAALKQRRGGGNGDGSPAAGGPAPALLEVGAGDGAFARKVSPELFPKAGVLCTEFSPAGAARIRADGFACEAVDVRALDADRYRHHFTAACMFQVLEHLDDLDGLGRALSALAAPGADLFFSVPNDAAIEFAETHGAELDMPPNHVGRWNRRAFEALGRRHGWDLVRHAVEPSSRLALLRGMTFGRFFRARQTAGSITDRTTRIADRRLRRVCSLPVMGLWALATVPLALANDPTPLGGTQWAHFRKTSSE